MRKKQRAPRKPEREQTAGSERRATHLLAEDVPLVLSRQVLQALAVGLKKLPPAQLKEVG